MKKIILCLIFISISNDMVSQRMDLVLLNKLTELSIHEVDNYMINYNGFEKIENKSETNKMTYGRYYHNDLDNTIVITVVFREDQSNMLELSIAKNYDIEEIKKELINKGYQKQSLIDFEFETFKNEESTVLISIIPNELGKSKIKFISES